MGRSMLTSIAFICFFFLVGGGGVGGGRSDYSASICLSSITLDRYFGGRMDYLIHRVLVAHPRGVFGEFGFQEVFFDM